MFYEHLPKELGLEKNLRWMVNFDKEHNVLGHAKPNNVAEANDLPKRRLGGYSPEPCVRRERFFLHLSVYKSGHAPSSHC
jgi:hypothetical protein